MEKKTNSKALLAFILSIVGIFFFGVILGIISIVMGNNALNEINVETENGYGLAKAAKIIGIIDLVGGIIGGLILLLN